MADKKTVSSKKQILSVLNKLKKEIKEDFRVEKIGLFGSYAVGVQKLESDIDILVRFTEDADLFDFVGLGLFLEEKLGQKVDLVPEAAIRFELREPILKQAAYV